MLTFYANIVRNMFKPICFCINDYKNSLIKALSINWYVCYFKIHKIQITEK